MHSHAADPPFLLGCFADFYQEVANLKLVIAQGRLPAYLSVGDETPPTRGAELAVRVSARLEALLRQQTRAAGQTSSRADMKLLGLAQFVMAAVADETFLLELQWAGRDTWLEVLLERRLFQSQSAGTRFFELARQLTQSHQRSEQLQDAAAVFLLALQLGFKGMLRGDENQPALQAFRHQLYRYAEPAPLGHATQPAFPEAYAHRETGRADARLAPLSRWWVAAQVALAAYLAVSTLVWLAAMWQFEHAA